MATITVSRELSRQQTRPRVLVIGVGGLGCPVAELLARTQTCDLVLADGDIVDRSNLPRQWLYGDADVGKKKTDAAAARLKALFPSCNVDTAGTLRLPADRQKLTDCALAIDCTDDVDLKFALNDAAVARGLPFISGGVIGLRGYALRVLPGQSVCLRCVFEGPNDDMRRTCRDAGVLAPLPSLVGSVMAAMALRALASEQDEPLWSIDLSPKNGGQKARASAWKRREDCSVCGGAR